MTRLRFFSAAALIAALASPFAAHADNKSGDEIARATCGDIFSEFAAADPKLAKGSADEVAAAQDNVYSLIMWVHGYLSGRDGIDFAKRPLNQAGIGATVEKIIAACKTDEKQPFLTAIRGIK